VVKSNINFLCKYLPKFESMLGHVKNSNTKTAFGSLMPQRSFASEGYRFGFIGAENDNEVYGNGNSQNHSFRDYDPRLGRYKSVDPLAKDFPWNSPFTYAENDVIRSIDLEGRERYIMITNLATEKSTQIELSTAGKLGEGILYVTQSQKGLSSIYHAPIEFDNLGNVSGGEINRVPISFLDSKTQGKLIENTSPLSMGAKSAIMKDIATPDVNLTKDEVRFGANVLDYGGTGVQVFGYGVTLFGAPQVGIPLAEGGATISTIGSGIKATLDASEGNFTGAAIELVGFGVGKAASKGVDGLKTFEKGSKDILKQNVGLKTNFGGKLIESQINQTEDKDE
jgi:RHS repeat-associated protein